ncbi:hypothetical protein ANSO36C_63420 (plasmid) [Nostoc cf. commune SO-36]|uniref:DUF3854 domain-containing protein n=1 Tax=Nostoc cf. commune SO-36 TaxID=449208 RepID=A0ABN6QD59_NOSCO|nr:DUF3854 domain-containing protein [Nostoc commune]BDI20540.1 hypothetical protein ANSO36C_63420 [Nostoc cf. commune SO-36]
MDEFVNLRPNHIEPKHWHELVVDSAIHPIIASANFKSLYYDSIEQSHESWEYLMYSDQIERKNAGRLGDKTLQLYAYLDSTDGWWCDAGVDPRTFCDLQPGDKPKEKLWGCYKPDSPRPDPQKPGKFIKYEHPYKVELSIFLLEVPKEIAELIYFKAGVNPSLSDRQSGFWFSVWKHNIPVTIAEGAKKAASILTQGDAAIGLPGVNAAYRSKDDQGNPIESKLRSEIAMFATPDREMRICFDHDSKSKTQVNVGKALIKTSQLLVNHGAKVIVITLPGPEKGVDDLIAALGAAAYEKLKALAVSFEDWQQNNPLPDRKQSIFLKNGQELKLKSVGSEILLTPTTPTTTPTEASLTRLPPLSALHPLSPLPLLSPTHPLYAAIKSLGIKHVLSTQQPEGKTVSQSQTSSQIDNQVIIPEAPQSQVSPPSEPFSTQNSQNTESIDELDELDVLKRRRRQSEIISDTIEDNKTFVEKPSSVNKDSFESSSIPTANSWVNIKQVTVYKQTIPRRFLEAKQNQDIAFAARELIKNYGVQQDDGSIVYRADAFLIKKNKSTYSIHRRQATNLDNPIMEFEASQYHINITQKPLDKFLPIERQEFLTVANTLKQGKELPSEGEDPRKIANSLSSLSPDGTHKILESFKSLEVLKILTSTLEAFNSHDLELGNYRITYTPNDENGGDIKLLKTEHNGTTRVAVHLELSRTDEQMSHQVHSMAINSLEIDKLRLMATKLQIPTINSAANAHATRDIPLPLHPALAEIWNLLETSTRWTSGANQGNEGFRERFQKDPNAKLTLGEQSQLYFKFLIQTKEEIILYGKTDIILPPLSKITGYLKLLREQSINNFYSPKISQNAETQKPTQEEPHNPEPQLNNLEV